MHAVVTVTASGSGAASTGRAGAGRRAAELLIVDTSGSMKGPKLRAGKGGHGGGHRLPARRRPVRRHRRKPRGGGGLPVPGRRSPSPRRAPARGQGGGQAVRGRRRHGHRHVDRLAAQLLRDEPGIRHAILLTDGKNESEEPEDFERRPGGRRRRFQCDCRGVGDGLGAWRSCAQVATALVGTYDIVAAAGRAGGRLLPDAAGFVEPPGRRGRTAGLDAARGPRSLVLKQMDPPLDLTDNRVDVGRLAGPTMPPGRGATRPATTTLPCVSPWQTRRGWPPGSLSSSMVRRRDRASSGRNGRMTRPSRRR